MNNKYSPRKRAQLKELNTLALLLATPALRMTVTRAREHPRGRLQFRVVEIVNVDIQGREQIHIHYYFDTVGEAKQFMTSSYEFMERRKDR